MIVTFNSPSLDISFNCFITPLTTIDDVIEMLFDTLKLSTDDYFTLDLEISAIKENEYDELFEDIVYSFSAIKESFGVDEAIASLIDFVFLCESKESPINYLRFFKDAGFNNPLSVATMIVLHSAKILPDVKTYIDLLKYKDEYYCGKDTDREDIGIACYIHTCLEGIFTNEGYFFHD